MAYGDGITAALVLVVDKNTLRLNGVNYVKERTCENVSEADYGFKCSICGDWEDIDHPKYCAHCGAKVVE